MCRRISTATNKRPRRTKSQHIATTATGKIDAANKELEKAAKADGRGFAGGAGLQAP